MGQIRRPIAAALLSAAILSLGSADCNSDCDNAHPSKDTTLAATCKQKAGSPPHEACTTGFDIGYFVACTGKCSDADLDADVLKSKEVVDSSCAPPHQAACSAGFRAGIDLGAAGTGAAPAADAGSAPADPATCSAKCEEPPADAKTKVCAKLKIPRRKTACEFGFDTGFMVMCGQVCEDAEADADVFKSKDVVDATCAGADKRFCSDGFRAGVDAAASPNAGEADIRGDLKKRYKAQEEKKAAAEQLKKEKEEQKKREALKRKQDQEKAQKEEEARQKAAAEKQKKQQDKTDSGAGAEPELDGKAKEAAVKAAERKRRQDAEEAARIKWLKEEEERERLAELEEEQELERREQEARAEAQKRLKDRGAKSREQVKRDKKIADAYAKEQKKKKKKKRGGSDRNEF